MDEGERLHALMTKTDTELCHAYNHPWLKPKTEMQIEKILRSRKIDKCDDDSKTRLVPPDLTVSNPFLPASPTQSNKETSTNNKTENNAKKVSCQTDSDCSDGKFCWSVIGGEGKECQVNNSVPPSVMEPKASISVIPVNNDISKLESTCSRIGFKKGTEQFGDCVLELKMRASKTK
jgi:hypothetical protein